MFLLELVISYVLTVGFSKVCKEKFFSRKISDIFGGKCSSCKSAE